MPYPDANIDIECLVRDHHATLDEDGKPLILAVYYRSAAAPNDECLFEVAQNFGGNEVSGIGEMMQVEFGPTPRYPLGGHSLRLTVTSPNECEVAIGQQWSEVRDLVEAAGRRQAKVVFRRDQDPNADRIAGTLGLADAV